MNPFAMTTSVVEAPTVGFKIYMAGDYDAARGICRSYCAAHGACYSLVKADYIYSGGEERGFIVNLINYPRFAESRTTPMADEIASLAEYLMTGLNQSSYTIEEYGGDNPKTTFYSRRKTT